VVGDISGLFHFSNRSLPGGNGPADRAPEMSPSGNTMPDIPSLEKIAPGIHGLSNSLLDVPWPKVLLGKQKLRSVLMSRKKPTPERLFALLDDRAPAPDDALPATGVGLEWERMLSPLFIHRSVPAYGTRSSTVILVDRAGTAVFAERVFDEHGTPWMTTRFVIPRKFDAIQGIDSGGMQPFDSRFSAADVGKVLIV
jgi:uncharacterized protein with NRDE domain